VNVNPAQARQRFVTAAVARMATAGSGAQPHLVPVTFALVADDTLVTAVDHKPKRTVALARLANIAVNPHVSLLVDHYADDWDELWWARADGLARVVGPDDEIVLRELALDALAHRYHQYAERRPAGDLIVVQVSRWSGWQAAG